MACGFGYDSGPAGLFWKGKVRLDDALAISAIVFIFYQPYVLFQPGFQLSYLAACSLVYSTSILAAAKSALMTSFFVTSISQLALYPVLLFHFHELSISSFVVNLLYVPLVFADYFTGKYRVSVS